MIEAKASKRSQIQTRTRAQPTQAAAGETSADGNPSAGAAAPTDPAQPGSEAQPGTSSGTETGAASQISQKEPVPLVDYISNVMKFVDAILSNNSTDDHCREFVNQKGDSLSWSCVAAFSCWENSSNNAIHIGMRKLKEKTHIS